jgi:hypothetical protein
MKTIIFRFCMGSFLVIAFILFACTKDENDVLPVKEEAQNLLTTPIENGIISYINWKEDFSSQSCLKEHWNFFGSQKPNWIGTNFERFGLYDNNGTPPWGNCAVSKNVIGDGRGYILESEVYINLTNPSGTCICPSIGVTKILNPTPFINNQPVESGIMMRMKYLGAEIGNVPPWARHHTWLQIEALLEDGSIATPGEYAIPVDDFVNGWHKMKIIIPKNRFASFYLDNQLVWQTPKQIHKSLIYNKNLLLGSTSPGIAGKAYHDWVKITYITPD